MILEGERFRLLLLIVPNISLRNLCSVNNDYTCACIPRKYEKKNVYELVFAVCQYYSSVRLGCRE